jgi:hypothetical protein
MARLLLRNGCAVLDLPGICVLGEVRERIHLRRAKPIPTSAGWTLGRSLRRKSPKTTASVILNTPFTSLLISLIRSFSDSTACLTLSRAKRGGLARDTDSPTDVVSRTPCPSVAFDALLETAELIATGHPEGEPKHGAAVMLLLWNLTIALSTSLRVAQRVCSTAKQIPLENLT